MGSVPVRAPQPAPSSLRGWPINMRYVQPTLGNSQSQPQYADITMLANVFLMGLQFYDQLLGIEQPLCLAPSPGWFSLHAGRIPMPEDLGLPGSTTASMLEPAALKGLVRILSFQACCRSCSAVTVSSAVVSLACCMYSSAVTQHQQTAHQCNWQGAVLTHISPDNLCSCPRGWHPSVSSSMKSGVLSSYSRASACVCLLDACLQDRYGPISKDCT